MVSQDKLLIYVDYAWREHGEEESPDMLPNNIG